MPSIRAKVVCLLRNGDRMLLLQATDPHDRRRFWLPPGGGVEFGETLEQAVVREIFEELGLRIVGPKRIGMFESFFRFAGRQEHELVFVYELACDDAELCAKEDIVITESNGEQLPARWLTPADIVESGLPLFPFGLLEMLASTSADSNHTINIASP